jgi:hypothetical protein
LAPPAGIEPAIYRSKRHVMSGSLWGRNGVLGGTRTPSLHVRSVLLYPIGLQAHMVLSGASPRSQTGKAEFRRFCCRFAT